MFTLEELEIILECVGVTMNEYGLFGDEEYFNLLNKVDELIKKQQNKSI